MAKRKSKVIDLLKITEQEIAEMYENKTLTYDQALAVLVSWWMEDCEPYSVNETRLFNDSYLIQNITNFCKERDTENEAAHIFEFIKIIRKAFSENSIITRLEIWRVIALAHLSIGKETSDTERAGLKERTERIKLTKRIGMEDVYPSIFNRLRSLELSIALFDEIQKQTGIIVGIRIKERIKERMDSLQLSINAHNSVINDLGLIEAKPVQEGFPVYCLIADKQYKPSQADILKIRKAIKKRPWDYWDLNNLAKELDI